MGVLGDPIDTGGCTGPPRVSAEGGRPSVVTTPEGSRAHHREFWASDRPDVWNGGDSSSGGSSGWNFFLNSGLGSPPRTHRHRST